MLNNLTNSAIGKSAMYTITATYVKQDNRWEAKDVKSEPVEDILKYQNVRMTISWDGGTEVDIFTKTNLPLFKSAKEDINLSTWIQTVEEGAFNSTDKARGLRDSNVVKLLQLDEVADTIGKGNILFGNLDDVPVGAENDIVFTTNYPDYNVYNTKSLTENSVGVVNGLIYPTAFQHGKGHIIGASERLALEPKDAAIQLIDFSALGGCEQIPLLEENVTVVDRSMDDERRYITRTVVETGADLTDGTLLLVLDGYLHVLDGTCNQLSATQVEVIIDHYTVMQRAAKKPRNTRDWISPANLDKNGINTLSLKPAELIGSSSTFLIKVKTMDLAIMTEPLGYTGMPNTYYHHRAPQGLVFFDDGLLAGHRITDYNEHECQVTSISNERPVWTYEVARVMQQEGYIENGFSSVLENYKHAYVMELYSFA